VCPGVPDRERQASDGWHCANEDGAKPAPAQRKDIEDYLLGKTARPVAQYMREGQARWSLHELAAAGSPGKRVAAAAGAAADRRREETLEKVAKRRRR
jgi:hypothetical protein